MKSKFPWIITLICVCASPVFGQAVSYSNQNIFSSARSTKPANSAYYNTDQACGGCGNCGDCGSGCGGCDSSCGGCATGSGLLGGGFFNRGGGLFGGCGSSMGCDSGCGSCSSGCDSGCGGCSSGCGLFGGGLFGGGLFNRGMGSCGGCDSGCGCDSPCGGGGCGGGLLGGGFFNRGGMMGGCGCGRYVTVHGGYNMLNRYVGAAAPVPPSTFQRIADFNEGWSLGGAVGQEFGNGNRGELEFNYRNNTNDTYTINQFQNGNLVASQTFDATGNINSYTGMTNLYHNFNRLSNGLCVPYAGAGFGFTQVDGEINVNAINTTYFIDDNALSGQFMAGLIIPLGANVELFGEYRYFITDKVDIENAAGANVGDFNYENNSILFGLKINTN